MAPPIQVFEQEPASTREAIMQATYRALAEHGYADLTIQRIGDEFDKSKSLLYHHYDSKEALLVDFLEFMLQQMEADIPIEDQDNAYEQLKFALDHVFEQLFSEPHFLRAMLELRSQAGTHETYREQFTANEQFTRNRLTEIIECGIEEGTFREVDAARAGEMILTIIDGTVLRHTTIEDVDVDSTRRELDAYVRERLLADDFDRA